MSATLVALLGTVGVHGISADETGMVIDSLDDTTKKQSNMLKNRVGNRIGCADYDHSIEITLKGKLASSSPFVQKVSAELALTNAISADHLPAGAGTGLTLINEVARTRASEDWQGISVTAEMLPSFPSS